MYIYFRKVYKLSFHSLLMKDEWDSIYEKEHKKLPWFNLPFSKELVSLVDNFEKDKKLIVTGCGTGDTLDKLNKLGFKNLQGCDISKNAIKIAKNIFPMFDFKISKTEDIKERHSNFFDQYILHHIPSSGIKKYVENLDKIGEKIVCVFLYGSGKTRKSIIKKHSDVYHHNPKEIEKLFKTHKLIEQVSYSIIPNVPGKKIKYTAIAQYYIKR
jgi:hypothetical protein